MTGSTAPADGLTDAWKPDGQRLKAIDCVHPAFKTTTGGADHACGTGFSGTTTASSALRTLCIAIAVIWKIFPQHDASNWELLDIGHGSGCFLVIAALTGFFAHVWGIELQANHDNVMRIFDAATSQLIITLTRKQLPVDLTPIYMTWGDGAVAVDSFSEFLRKPGTETRFWSRPSDLAKVGTGCKIAYSFCKGQGYGTYLGVWANVARDHSVLVFVVMVDPKHKRRTIADFLHHVGNTFRHVESKENKTMHMYCSGEVVGMCIFARNEGVVPDPELLLCRQRQVTFEPDSLLAALHQLPGITSTSVGLAGQVLGKLIPGGSPDGSHLKVVRTEGTSDKPVWVVGPFVTVKGDSFELHVEASQNGDRRNSSVLRIADLIRNVMGVRADNNGLQHPVILQELDRNWVGKAQFDGVTLLAMTVEALEPCMEPVAKAATVVFEKEGRLHAEFHEVLVALLDALLFLHERQMFHNNLLPGSVMQRANKSHQSSLPLVLTDLARAQYGNVVEYGQGGGSGSGRSGLRCGSKKGEWKAVVLQPNGVQGQLKENRAYDMSAGQKDLNAVGRMFIMAMAGRAWPPGRG